MFPPTAEWELLEEDEKEQQAKLGRVAPSYSKPVARDFPDCIAIVEERVKPERTRTKINEKGEEVFVLRHPLPQKWWIYADKRPLLYSIIPNLSRALVAVQTSKFLSLSFQQSNIVFSHMTVVFAIEDFASFAVLNTSWHTNWIVEYCSSLETRLRYIPTDGFETFPFPKLTDDLEQIGAQYDEFRREIMLRRQEGLTQTYNRFHNRQETASDITALRELHRQMDEAVKQAYGWHDLELAHNFHETKQGIRFTISPEARQEVLDRLLELNFARHAEELAAGLWEKPKPAKKTKGGKKGKTPEPETKDGKPSQQGTFGFMPEQDSLF